MIFWEADYGDGALRERDGALYRDIDRSRLVGFRLVTDDRVLVNLLVEDAAMFAFRRRVSVGARSYTHYLIYSAPSTLMLYVPEVDRLFVGYPDAQYPGLDFALPIPHKADGEMF